MTPPNKPEWIELADADTVEKIEKMEKMILQLMIQKQENTVASSTNNFDMDKMAKMFTDLKSTLTPTAKLCIACNITLPDEYIRTLEIKDWKSEHPDLHKKPTIFIIHKD